MNNLLGIKEAYILFPNGFGARVLEMQDGTYELFFLNLSDEDGDDGYMVMLNEESHSSVNHLTQERLSELLNIISHATKQGLE